jgi:SAM-dependent methyltransferase
MRFIYSFSLLKIIVQSIISLKLNRKKYETFFLNYKYAFYQKNGFEIGGPSALFSTKILPVYNWANQIDGCNFSDSTLWEGSIIGDSYKYSINKSGKQYILEGTDLTPIDSGIYDFILSSHCLEHIANPLNAIREWNRVLKPGGFMLLVLPDRKFTFDRKRDYTPFSHLLSDYELKIEENDLTHLPEILKLHNLDLDPDAGKDYEAFKKRSENNIINRGLHHHIFSQNVLQQSFEYFNINVVAQYFLPPFHQIIIGQKNN